MNHRTTKRARFLARKLERAINDRLATERNDGRIRITARSMRKFSSYNLAGFIEHKLKAFDLLKDSESYERLATWVNSRLATYSGGLPIVEGWIECECGDELECLADPQEWTQRRDGRWKVTGFWPGMAHCPKCDLLLAFSIEGEARSYSFAKQT